MILGQFIMSENGRYKVEIDDANLVLSDDGYDCWSTSVPHHALGWQIETEFKFQDDGNLIVQRKEDGEQGPWTIVWASSTRDRVDRPEIPKAHHLTLQNDGNLVLYSREGDDLWRSGTQHGCRGGENGEL